MGTKRTNWTDEDSLQLPRNPAAPDRDYQLNKWTNHKARSQAGPEVQAEQVREREVRAAREMDRIRERPREGKRDVEQERRARERYAMFKERTAEADLRREEGRNTSGRTALRQEHEEYRQREKGDTFPKMSRQSNERETRARHSIDQGYEKDMRRLREADTRERGRDKDRERPRKMDRDIQKYREMERQRTNEEMRRRENGKRPKGRRLEVEDRMRESGWDIERRERRTERDTEVNDQQIMRRREADRDKDRAGHRKDRYYSPQRRRIMEGDGENVSDREERGKTGRTRQRERHRYTKSEGDLDEEEERKVRREEDSVPPSQDHSKSERDNERERAYRKSRERELRLEMERQRERARRKLIEQERYREADWQRERGNERETSQSRRREEDRNWMMEKYTEHYRDQDRKPRDWEREKRGPSGQRDQDSSSQDRIREKEFPSERAHSPYASDRQKPMDLESVHIKGEAPSNGEGLLGSELENNQSRQGITDNVDDKEKESISEGDREKKTMSSEGAREIIQGLGELELREHAEKQEMETEIKKPPQYKQRPHRKMWLEPRSGSERKDSLLEEYRERTNAKERYALRYTEQKTSTDEENRTYEGNTQASPEEGYRELAREFMQEFDSENMEERRGSDGSMEPVFDSEGSLDAPWQMEAENVADNIEGSDREDERGGDRDSNSEEEEEGSEGGWGEGKERMTSGDDGFVTVSSGADDDEADEDKFEDCNEFWDGGDREELTRQSPTRTPQSEGENETGLTKARSDRTVTVFCVVGQTLPRSGDNQNPLMDQVEQEEASEQASTEMGDGSDQDATLIGDESTLTAFTLSEEDISGNHDTKLDQAEYTNKDATVPEEDIMITGDGSVEKYNETHTADPEPEGVERNCHLEETGSIPEGRKRFSAAPHVKWANNVLSEILGSSEEGAPNMPESNDGMPSETENQRSPDSPLYGVVQKPRKHRHERTCTDPDSVHSRPDDKSIENEILIQVEGCLVDVELEVDEEAQYYMLQPSGDLNSLSSEGELEKEESGKKDSKSKKKPVWKMLSSSSFRDFGAEAWGRRKGVRRTIQNQNEDEEEAGSGRDRRTRVFPSEDEYDELYATWSEADLMNFKEKISRSRMRNSKFYNSQLYQQYSEVVQNRELLRQSHSDSNSVFGEVGTVHASSSPCPSPTLARRPLPALPPMPHPHSLPHTNSVSSASDGLASPLSPPQRSPSPRLSKSFASSPMLWQELPGVRNNPELKTLSDDQRRLQEVRFEVLTSEASYGSSLDIIVEHFFKCKQLNVHLTSQDRNWLFSRLCDVRAVSHSFFTQLEERVESDVMHFTVCDIIIKHCPRFRSVYVPYLTNQSYQDKTYQRLMNENSGFRHVVEKLEQSPKCQRLPFRSFLILPFQRITRLKLLVQNILKRTVPKSKDEAQAIKAMKLLEKMIQESNDSISQMKSIESLVSLNAKVDFECKTLPLISQSRRLVKEGPVIELRDFTLKERERATYIHLFNDYLLLSMPKEGGRFTVIDHAPVAEVRAENCRIKLHSLQKNVFRLHMSHKSILLRTDMQADQMRWISALSRPHPEIDFNAAQDKPQMQCIRAFVSQQPDELSLEKADVLLVHQQSSDGWVEGTRLSDRLRGWVPDSHLELIKSEKARQRNLIDALKITTATASG